MRFISFTPEQAEPILERIAREYEAKRGKTVPTDRIEHDWPAYRMPCGTVRIVYDLYKPDYPEGSIPGIADCSLALRYYPNDTSGYQMFPLNFRPFA